MNLAWEFVAGWLAVSGFIGFVLMGLDKTKARGGSRRIPEKVFFELAALGGAFGIALGAGAFHHKTRKGSFMGIIFALAMLWVVVLFGLTKILGLPA